MYSSLPTPFLSNIVTFSCCTHNLLVSVLFTKGIVKLFSYAGVARTTLLPYCTQDL